MHKNNSEEIHYWSVRKISPKILLLIAIVFLIFIAIAYFGFHSTNAVQALIYSALGSIVTLLPGVFTFLEYRLSKEKLEYRPIRKKSQKSYKTIFLVKELSHLVKTADGVKYYLKFSENNSIRRFWKKHISDKYSGEVKIPNNDTSKILDTFKNYGVSIHGKYLERKF